MRHRVKKIKFSHGRDANRMLVRKLAKNFFVNGKIETTLKKAKVLRSFAEKLVDKAKTENEPNKNVLLKSLGDTVAVKKLFKEIGPTVKNRKGGYIKLIKLGQRSSDGAEMVRLEWTVPVIKESPPSKLVPNKTHGQINTINKIKQTK